MRALLSILTMLALATSCLSAAAAPGPFSPVPFGLLQWSNDTPQSPTTAGLAGRWQVFLVVDIEQIEGKTGLNTYYNFAWNYTNKQTTDQRLIPILVTING